MVKIAAYRNDLENEKEEMLETAIDSFKQLIRKLKLAKVKNPFAYFYGILNCKFERHFCVDLFEEFDFSKSHSPFQMMLNGELITINL